MTSKCRSLISSVAGLVLLFVQGCSEMPVAPERLHHLDEGGVVFNPDSVFVGRHLRQMFDNNAERRDNVSQELLLAHSVAKGRTFLVRQEDWEMFYSDNRGRTWTPLHIPRTSLGTGLLNAIRPSVVDPDVIFAGTLHAWTDSRMMRSGDGGLSWREIDLPANEIAAFVLHPTLSGRIYAMTGDPWDKTIFLSDDYGDSWTVLWRGGATELGLLVISPVAPHALYSGTWVSDDGGADWRPIPHRVVHVDDHGRLYMRAEGPGRILRSADGGQTWEVVHESSEWKAGSFATDAAHGTILIVSDVVLISTDDGATWREIGSWWRGKSQALLKDEFHTVLLHESPHLIWRYHDRKP